ncbi:hypothetical protein A3E39_03245 [Candidatus Uhrbacteria bacterium RIFCSPHIGHO2_12_FULL_60_25]|uniref:HTH HARE-type domain-containing protein n=1 Tax=Candidatus Uhrbacteria bacterium RIFCSPHIGHO2_12_FULL_60_25 TaxID=1802399 RepID=A0A1F7UNG8_9BACT|nr:MAG: hypothetical protein A3D73_00745 [Candidatus Uhrbacteria bacterium RIFCSPHIGHO2_02_FULL_60_44]OGL79799.1 MAG: hypothetical protein A3E39_03245 [Candidatus Uhrbacteria bacterium RIFCSPHIGHO2_12_FULL_60_25]
MSKTIDEKLNERLDEIERLKKEIAEKRDRLLKLTGLLENAPKGKMPDNFSYKEAILRIFRENPDQELRIRAVVKEIQKRDGFQPDPKVVQSSMNNLDGKELTKIKEEGKRGTFKLKQ